MAIKNTLLGGTDWGAEEVKAADMNDTFNAAVTKIQSLSAFWLNSDLYDVYDSFSGSTGTSLNTHTATNSNTGATIHDPNSFTNPTNLDDNPSTYATKNSSSPIALGYTFSSKYVGVVRWKCGFLSGGGTSVSLQKYNGSTWTTVATSPGLSTINQYAYEAITLIDDTIQGLRLYFDISSSTDVLAYLLTECDTLTDYIHTNSCDYKGAGTATIEDYSFSDGTEKTARLTNSVGASVSYGAYTTTSYLKFNVSLLNRHIYFRLYGTTSTGSGSSASISYSVNDGSSYSYTPPSTASNMFIKARSGGKADLYQNGFLIASNIDVSKLIFKTVSTGSSGGSASATINIGTIYYSKSTITA